MPISFLLFLLRAQIVRLVLGAGQFGWLETRLTAASLGLFCLGIFAAAFVPFLARVFYSLQNTKTPAIISLLAMALNVALSFLFVGWLLEKTIFQDFLVNLLKLEGISEVAVVGLPLALSISSVFNFVFLLLFLGKTLSAFPFLEIWQSFKRIVLASLALAVSVYFSLSLTAGIFNTDTVFGLFFQALIAVVVGPLVYLFTAYLFKFPEFKTIKSSLAKH